MVSSKAQNWSWQISGFLGAVIGFVLLNLLVATQWGIPWSIICLALTASSLFVLERQLFEAKTHSVSESDLFLDGAFPQIVIDSMAAAVIVTDHVGNFVYFNPKATQLTGVGLVEAQVSEWSDTYGLFELDGKTFYPPHRLPLARALSGEAISQQELFLRNRHHVQGIFLSVSASPIRDTDGYIRGAVAVFEDVSARKQLEQEVRQREIILSDQVKLRTDELNRSNEELKRFAHVVAHDLKEPIRSMTALSQLVERQFAGKFTEEQDKWIAEIVHRGQRLNRFIDDLLLYAKAKEELIKTAVVDLEDLVCVVGEDLEAGVRETGAALEIGKLPKVLGESSHMTQIFQNLIANSLKYAGTTKPAIKIGARAEDGHWLFWVKDNGIGVPPGKEESIFVPFYRAHELDARSGSGIGLAICKRIVERYGGKIWAESEEGRGTSIFFTIPSSRVLPSSEEEETTTIAG